MNSTIATAFSNSGSAGGRGWTEHSEGSPGVSGAAGSSKTQGATGSASASGRLAHDLSLRLEPWSASALTEWRCLERRIGDVPLAASSGWTAAWVNAYGDALDVRIALAEHTGGTCGVALVCRSREQRVGPWRLHTWHVGTAGETAGESACVEYNALLVEDGRRRDFAQRLVELAKAERGIDEVRLDGFDAATAADLLDALPGADVTHRASRYCDLRAIRERGATVMESLGGSTRSSLRRALKKSGAIEVTQARSVAEADDILTELIELHQARWQAAGRPGAFASARFTRFQRELVTRLLPEERIVLLRVRNASRTIGCLLLLVDRGRLLDYLSGFAAFDQTPSPGIVTHYLAMERALAQGYSAYDFLVGDKRHKANLATHARDLIWATWRRPTWKNRTIAGLRKIKRTLAAARGHRPAVSAEAEAAQ